MARIVRGERGRGDGTGRREADARQREGTKKNLESRKAGKLETARRELSSAEIVIIRYPRRGHRWISTYFWCGVGDGVLWRYNGDTAPGLSCHLYSPLAPGQLAGTSSQLAVPTRALSMSTEHKCKCITTAPSLDSATIPAARTEFAAPVFTGCHSDPLTSPLGLPCALRRVVTPGAPEGRLCEYLYEYP